MFTSPTGVRLECFTECIMDSQDITKWYTKEKMHLCGYLNLENAGSSKAKWVSLFQYFQVQMFFLFSSLKEVIVPTP